MDILDQVTKSTLNFKGQVPNFDAENFNSTWHNTSDTLGVPKFPKPPSQLSEDKTTDFYKDTNTYLQNLPS